MIETVLVKLASRCNLDCSYCYVYRMGDDGWARQPKRMSTSTVDLIAARLKELFEAQSHPFVVVFHGGEPLLIGPKRFGEVCSALRLALPLSCGLALQTNGVLLTPEVVDACVRYDVSVSVSLDGPASVHDGNRCDLRGRPSHAAVLSGIGRLTATASGRDLFSGVLAVIDPGSDPVEVYEHLKSTGAPTADFLYRDGNHDVLPFGKTSFATVEYGSWMMRLLDHYLADREPMRIRVLDDMLKLLLGGQSTKEGLGSNDFGIIVVETDGTVTKNDTLKSAHPGADRFERTWSLTDNAVFEIVSSEEYRAYQSSQPPGADVCRQCPELAVCGGGMPAHRWSRSGGHVNPTVFCNDQLHLIGHMRAHLRRNRIAA